MTRRATKSRYWRNCMDWPADRIDEFREMMESAKRTTYDAFKRNLTPEDFAAITYALNYDRPYHLRKDQQVKFFRVLYHETYCYILQHSHIEYIFVQGLTAAEATRIPSRFELQDRIRTGVQQNLSQLSGTQC